MASERWTLSVWDFAAMMARLMAALSKTWLRPLLDRVEGGDCLLFLYTVGIIRQYLCWVPVSNAIAWLIAALAGGFVLGRYVLIREADRSASLPFWIVFAVPLFLSYLLRVAFPDLSFDVLNHRLFQQVRALDGFLDRPGDFFPTPGPFNTVPDMAFGITRYLFGYRLGTILNFFALLWSGRILDRLFRSQIPNDWLRAFCVLATFAAEHLFFEINTYLVDLLALPLLLEATRLALQKMEPARRNRHVVQIAFLIGVSVALKLTNLVLALPIVLLCTWTFVIGPRAARFGKELLRVSLFSIAGFLGPVLPFSLYLYQQTGSPVFPILNGVFKSPYWPFQNMWDPRWGPRGLWETLSWPVQILFHPERLSELSLYSGRLSLGLLAAALALFIAWRNKDLRRLCFLVLASLFLWSGTTGYIRYALFLELLSGLLLVMLIVESSKNKRQLGVALLFICLSGTQTILACQYIASTEWSRRPTIFKLPEAWKSNARYFLRDRSLRSFSSSADRTRFDRVEVWIESSMKTVGFEILLNEKAPVIGLRCHESFVSPESRLRFVHAIEAAAGKRMFSLCFAEDLADALKIIDQRGLIAGAQTPLSLPFYSREFRLPLILIEVSGAEQAAATMRKTL
jgi:hypothetical protein